ncbi:MAG: histone-like nucleoid-structuring protein Lsr2 [Acidimicrobiales bacterium]
MARIEEVTVTLIDDFDGTEAAETVSFSLDGKVYEIDLTKANAAEFRRTLKPYVDRARSTRAGRRPGRKRQSQGQGQSKYDAAEVRAWAKANRVKVAPRGRISSDVVERWKKATKR